uniref:Uncharacterized protein n=1 Tax=Panagrolaimus sp. ES5 TaxID=591445 RepID=A0AC34G8V2_9BILA
MPEIAQFKASQKLVNPNKKRAAGQNTVHETPSATDTTMRFVTSLVQDDQTLLSNSSSNNSVTSVTLTQNVWRKNTSTPNLKRKSQFIVTMATAESMTDIFPEWINFALYGTPGHRRYRPYDLNMPLAIPR